MEVGNILIVYFFQFKISPHGIDQVFLRTHVSIAFKLEETSFTETQPRTILCTKIAQKMTDLLYLERLGVFRY